MITNEGLKIVNKFWRKEAMRIMLEEDIALGKFMLGWYVVRDDKI